MRHNDTICTRFKEIVRKQPQAVAIVTDNRSVTFATLDRLADSMLAKFNKSPHRYIGIVMSHGIEMIAAILAVLKSGAAYVPAEKSLPALRRDYMMRRAGVRLIVDDDFGRGITPVGGPLPDRSSEEGVAYVLYTSGTTGRPKGVMVRHKNVVNYAEAFQQEFKVGPGDVMLQYSVCTFDIFVEEVFATLLNGATLAIPSEEVTGGSIPGLMEFAARHGVTIISGFPYLLAAMNKLHTLPPSLRLLISGGDVLRSSYINRLRDMGVRIYNTYGPSETTVCATYHRCDNTTPLPDGTFPIGHPVKGVSVTVRDSRLAPLPPGRTGEICISGAGVSLGYLGNPPEQNNFVTMPDGSRLYRSGDMGYLAADGNFVFLRRKDDQVMILGKRVEPEEVENILNKSPEVDRGIVRPFADDSGLAYLVAYFVPARKDFSLHKIKSFLKSELTDFMIPEFFVAVKDIPLTRHGKPDTASLPIVLKEGGLDDRA